MTDPRYGIHGHLSASFPSFLPQFPFCDNSSLGDHRHSPRPQNPSIGSIAYGNSAGKKWQSQCKGCWGWGVGWGGSIWVPSIPSTREKQVPYRMPPSGVQSHPWLPKSEASLGYRIPCLKKPKGKGWEDGSEVDSTGYSCEEPEFISKSVHQEAGNCF